MNGRGRLHEGTVSTVAMGAVSRRTQRNELVDAILAEGPAIIACFAAAGYGKSLLARRAAARFESVFVFDCALLGGAESAIAALESAASVGADGVSLDGRMGDLLRALPTAQQSQVLAVFDNADALDARGRGLLRDFITRARRQITILVGSRTVIDNLSSRGGAVRDVVVVTERDLRFGEDEIQLLFDPPLDPPTVRRLEEITHGWPLAVDYLRRLGRGRLKALLHDTSAEEFRTLHEYIAGEILPSLEDVQVEALCALSVGGPLTASDVGLAVASDARRGADIARTLPLVRMVENQYVIQPMLSAFLHEHVPGVRERVARRFCQALVARREPLRAATIALNAGDPDAAASILEGGGYLISSNRVFDAADVIFRIDRDVLVRHAGLWNVATLHRALAIPRDQWLEEGLRVWSTLSANESLDVVVGVANNLVNVYITIGEWDRLTAFLEDAAARYEAMGRADDPLITQNTRFVKGWIAAHRMESFDLRAYMRSIEPLFATEYVHALVLFDVVSRVHAARGDFDMQQRVLQEAVVRAQRTQIPMVIGPCLQEAAITAWFRGHDDVFERHVTALEALVTSTLSLSLGVGHFLACARDEGLSSPVANEHLEARAWSWLLAASRAGEPGTRRALLDEALRAANASGQPQVMIYARLAVDAATPRGSDRRHEAWVIAAKVDAPFWRSYLEHGEHAERLEPFLARFRLFPHTKTITVHMIDASVTVGNERIAMSPKEFALIALLAHHGALTAEALIDDLWPDSSEADGIASLRVYVNRIRNRLRDRGAVISRKGRYVAGNHVQTDLARTETFVKALPRQGTIALDVAERALDTLAGLSSGPPAMIADIPRFASLHSRFNKMLEDLEEWMYAHRADLPPSIRQRIDNITDRQV